MSVFRGAAARRTPVIARCILYSQHVEEVRLEGPRERRESLAEA